MTVRALRRGSIAASRVTSVPFTLNAPTLREELVSSSGGTSVTIGPITPAANALVLVWAAASGAAAAPSSMTGWGITFTRVAFYFDAGFAYGLALFAGSAASPTTGTGSFNLVGGSNGWGYRVEDWTGSSTPTVRQVKNSPAPASASTAAITLDTPPQASSAAVGLFLKQGNTTLFTAGSDFTAGLNAGYTTPTTTIFTEYDIGPADGAVDCTFSSAFWAGIAAEIGAP